ncbi:Lysosomal acid phosphatase [Ceratocystis platani]|uniref:Lysosomal acid phosphatase n=1 Tax=Ceratocystis fimbriata f. sp. platani TaxID=88771 RepID=A0A0F8CNN1_CERFI|nr:Lysosomal acid phosphatase [Ceratocystis platani]
MLGALKIAPLLALASSAAAETVYGAAVFSRHGDRTTKHYKNQQLTTVGANQNFVMGSAYRSRYLLSSSEHQIANISEDKYVSSQVYASAPDSGILLATANYFLQGLYPPLDTINAAEAGTALANGTKVAAPLAGYQYVTLHAEDANSPDTMWIKGDENCPAQAATISAWEASPVFAQRVSDSKDFYESMYPALNEVYDYTDSAQLSYAQAYDIYDLINVARIHNASSPAANVTDEQLFQLRTLADSAEFGANFNATNTDSAIHARTLIAAFVSQLNTTVIGKGKLKFSLFSGSYNTMLAFFGMLQLPEVSPDFYGLPDYASTMGFELFTADNTSAFPADPNNDLRVRFLFRNGTEGTLQAFPLFGTGEDSLTWADFKSRMEAVSIPSTKDWCNACGSTQIFCLGYQQQESVAAAAAAGASGDKDSMSNTVAGVIGAMVTLGVFSLAGLVTFILFRRKSKVAALPVVAVGAGNGSVHSSVDEKTHVSMESNV